MGAYLGVPISNRDYTLLGSIRGSPIQGNYQFYRKIVHSGFGISTPHP